jgi:hypothetical protein
MYYTFVKELVRSGASNLSGLIGARTPEEANFKILQGTPSDSEVQEGLVVYKKIGHDVFLVAEKVLGLHLFIKIESLQSLLKFLKVNQVLFETSDYINSFDDDDDDEDSE